MPKAWLIIKRYARQHQGGFSLVEVLLAVTVFGMLLIAVGGAIIYGRASTASAGDRQRAIMLAEEGIEATRNIATASYANLAGSAATTVGDTTIEGSFDFNPGGTSATKVTTGASGGTVNSISIYIKAIDATNPHVQAAIYADSSGTPGARLGASSIQTAVANSWNVFAISGVTVAPSTSYWLALSEDGQTQFAYVGGPGISIYRVTGGYPAPNPFAADAASSTDRPSFYMSVGGGGATSPTGLAQTGNQWVFSGTSDTNGIYTRQITLTANGANRETITSTVTWPSSGGTTNTVSISSQVANWASSIKLWSNAIAAGSVDATSTTDGLKIATAGNYAYLVRNGTTSNFIVMNISNPAAPTIVSTSSFANTPTNIAVSGNYAYVTTATPATSLEVINISNPASPSLATSVSMTGIVGAKGVYISGNYAYVVRPSDVTTNANELTVVNITTPTSPTVVGGYNNNIAMNEVYVSGNYAYIATSSTTQEMLVINVTTPASPTLAATYNPITVLAALTVTGYGNTVLLGMSTTLDAINVTTPTAPTRLGTFTAAGTINDVEVDTTNQFAFLGTASTTGEFQVVNIGTPASITLAKTVDVTGTTSTISGIAYNSSLDVVLGASASDTQEGLVFTRN